MILATSVLGLGGIVVGVMATGLVGNERWWPITWLAWAPVGAVILLKRPGNGVGRALLAIGGSWGLSFTALAIAVNSSADSIRAWSELIGLLFGVVPWLGIVWLLLVFPSGRLPGSLERVIAAGVFAVGGLALISFALGSSPMDTTELTSPLALPVLDRNPMTSWLVSDSGFVVVFLVAFAAVVSLVVRWRASSGVERHQFRWLLSGASIYLASLAIGQVAPDDDPLMIVWIASGAAIPVAIGVAVLRYRLYEIDRIISRTVAYAMVVVLLGTVFVLGVVAIPNLMIGTRTAPPLLVAASTLAVAALFNPLRRRLQRAVDRRFNRSRFDVERVMDGFADSLRDRVSANEVADGWVGVVSDTMQPSSVGMWLKT